jgi:hypothetical protein
MRKLRAGVIIALLACFSILLLAPATASAATAPKATSSHSVSTPISGTLSNGYTFAGTFTITKFVSQGNQLLAVGTVTGTVQKATTSGAQPQAVQSVTIPAAIPVTNAVASCSILALTLGPLDLNLLGLYVHLNQVVLNITAIPGAGSLLGNLLCSIAGLLNGGLPLSGLTGILNQILGAL